MSFNLARGNVAPSLAMTTLRSTLAPKSIRCKAIASPKVPSPAESDFDRHERLRLESTDAFAELQAVAQAKQSTNRPQKV